MKDYDYSMANIYSTTEAEDVVKKGEELVVELTKMSGDEDVPYSSVHEMLANQMVSSADYGLLVAALLEYHDDDSYADDMYDAIENALSDYIDREWYRVCGVNGSGISDDSFMR